MLRALLAMAAVVTLLGASSLELDSQFVLQRYTMAIDEAPMPKAVVFSYTVSQAGPTNIEQRHEIYRSGTHVRDELLAVDGVALTHKIVRFSHREDPYAFRRFAPRTAAYELLFVKTVKDGHHLDYLYDATPLVHVAGATIQSVEIDGIKYLPRMVSFATRGPDAQGTARVEFAPFGKYWMPVLAEADADVKGKPARERIVWNDYRFPASLPASAFQPPKPLPHATLPPI
jgi:hypothetical protein